MKYRKILLIALAIITVLLFASCWKEFLSTYIFAQKSDHITKIEIMYQNLPIRDYEIDLTLRKEIDQEDHETFLDELLELDGNAYHPPYEHFGPFVIQITYADGERELIGVYNNGSISTKGQFDYCPFRFRDKDGFYGLIEKYLGEDVSEEVEAWERAYEE